MSSPETQRRSPYKGLIPYAEGDAPFFFGREKETRLISANLFASPLTLLYGASGVGKSSVLRAGVAHQLRQRKDLLVVVFNSWQGNPVNDLKQAVADWADLADHAAWKKAVSLLPQDRPASLSEFLTICADRLGRRLMIILDQFEEYFLYHPQDDEFATEFPRTVTQTDAAVSFLISIREDFYAKLDRFEGRIPALYDNYLRIEHLDRQAARAAIEKPITQYNRLNATAGQQFSIEPELVQAVLKQVETGRVILGEAGRGVIEFAKSGEAEAQIETPFLQLVMTRLWDEEMRARSHKLRLVTLNNLGGAENIVRSHLEAVIGKLTLADQEIAANIFHYLVTPSGTKIAYTASDLAGSAELQEAEVVRVLEKLCHGDVRILRPVDPPLDRPSAPRYEIFHDVLAPAILAWRAGYVQAQERAEAERRSEEQQRKAEEQARIGEQAKVAGRLRRLVAALAISSLLGFGFVVYAFDQRVKAQANERRAISLQQEAEGQAKLATASASDAKREEGEARRQTELAVASEKRATTARSEAENQRERANQQAQIAAARAQEADTERAVAISQKKKADDALIAEHEAKTNLGRQLKVSNLNNQILSEGPTRDESAKARIALLAVESMRISPSLDAYQALRSVLNLSLSDPRYSNVVSEERAERIAFSPDGRYIAVANGTTKVLNASDGHEVINLGPANAIAFSPDGHSLATAGKDEFAEVWEVVSRTKLAVIAHEGIVNTVAFAPNGRYLATGGADSTVRVWEVARGKEIGHKTIGDAMTGAKDPVNAVAFSPDGRYFAGASSNGVARVFRLDNLQEIAQMTHDDSVNAIAFSPSGRYLATASDDKTARVWETANGKEVAHMTHGSEVNAVAFSFDGHYLATASSDGTARVWETISSQAVASLIYKNRVEDIAFSPDGRHLAIAAVGNPVRSFIWRTEDLVDMACAGLTRNFTEQEWSQYFSDEPYRLTCPSLASGMEPEIRTTDRPILGTIRWRLSPLPNNPENIVFLDDWEAKNIVRVIVPQLVGVRGAPTDGGVLFYKEAADQLKAAWAEIEERGLLDRVLTWDGAFVARTVRGSKNTLSHHSFGTAFDINAAWNQPSLKPLPAGEKGSVLDLVPIFEKHGFSWGGKLSRPDAMHFEFNLTGK